MIFTDDNGNKWEAVENPTDTNIRVIKPVKKTDKEDYQLNFKKVNYILSDNIIQLGRLTPTQANKLSEAISALVEYVQSPTDQYTNLKKRGMISTADEAREAMNE